MEEKNHHILDDLIEKYLEKACSPKEKILLDRFMQKEQQHLLWEKHKMGEKAEVVAAIKKGIAQKRSSTLRKRILSYSIAAAAVLILIISIPFLLKIKSMPARLITVQTAAVMDSIQLIDGSKIYLSPNSIFTYREDFNKEYRKVSLIKGNAFFKVTHNPRKPFVVTSNAIKTKVLGTSFNIHLGCNNYNVLVHTGKVNVSCDKESVTITPYEEATFSLKGRNLTTNVVDHNEVLSWYNSNITLTDKSLQIILKIVARKYGIESVRLKPEQLQEHATVFIAQQASLTSVLEQLNYVTNLKLIANGKEITSIAKAGQPLKK